MNAWCLTKISTLLFEFSALGLKFTLVRLIIDIPGVLIMSYFVSLLTPKNELEKIYNEKISTWVLLVILPTFKYIYPKTL